MTKEELLAEIKAEAKELVLEELSEAKSALEAEAKALVPEVIVQESAEQKFMTGTQLKAFNAIQDTVDQKEFSDACAIKNFLIAARDKNEVALKALSEGTDSAGGYLVPKPLSDRIYKALVQDSIARQEMTVVTMTSETLDLTALSTRPTVYYVSEGDEITESQQAYARKTLTAEKVAAIVVMSNEVLEDANVDLINEYVGMIAEGFVVEENKAFFNTCAAAGITGIIQDASTNVVTMGSGLVDFSDIDYATLKSMVYALSAKDRSGAKWCMHGDVIAHVAGLVDGNSRPIWFDAVAGQPARLLGFPVVENDGMPSDTDSAVSTEFITFGNYKNYMIGDRKALTTKVLTEGTVGGVNLATKDSTGVRAIARKSGIAPIPTQFVTAQTAAA